MWYGRYFFRRLAGHHLNSFEYKLTKKMRIIQLNLASGTTTYTYRGDINTNSFNLSSIYMAKTYVYYLSLICAITWVRIFLEISDHSSAKSVIVTGQFVVPASPYVRPPTVSVLLNKNYANNVTVTVATARPDCIDVGSTFSNLRIDRGLNDTYTQVSSPDISCENSEKNRWIVH